MAKKVTQEYVNGFLEALKVIEINKGSMTQDAIDFERNHILSQEVEAPTQHEISKAEIASKAAQLREFNKQLVASDALIKNIVAGVESLPGSFVHLAEKLSALKQ